MRHDLLELVKGLGVAERVELVEAIWDTVDERAGLDDLDVPDAHRAELDRRLADLAAGDAEMSSWDDVRARLVERR